MGPAKALTRAAKQATKVLISGWIVMPLSLALYLAVIAISALVSPIGGMAAGLIIGIASLVALVQFYSWCWRLLHHERINMRAPWGLVDHIFSNVAFVGFILWIAFSLIVPIGQSVQSPIALFVKLGVAFAFNPIAEVAVLGLASQGALFTEAFRITKDHLLTWFLPVLILIALATAVSGVVPSVAELAMQFAAGFDVMFPASYFLSITSSIIDGPIIGAVLAAPLACWFTLFRLSLLEQLE
jgi:hypothetical protein